MFKDVVYQEMMEGGYYSSSTSSILEDTYSDKFNRLNKEVEKLKAKIVNLEQEKKKIRSDLTKKLRKIADENVILLKFKSKIKEKVYI